MMICKRLMKIADHGLEDWQLGQRKPSCMISNFLTLSSFASSLAFWLKEDGAIAIC